MKKLCRLVVACLTGSTLLSCGDGPSAPVRVLTTLSVSFPTGTIMVGESAAATAAGLDQFGDAIPTGPVSWSTGSTAIATVNGSGVVTGVGAGQTQIIATAGGKAAQATVTVNLPPVASVTVSPPTATLGIGSTLQLAATTRDANSNTLTGRVVTWESSDPSKATVGPTTGVVTAVAVGSATITATSEGRSGTSQITVNNCNSSNALQLSLGAIHRLTAAETASLCLGGSASASEYVLIPFNSTNVAASTIQVQITGSNTFSIQPGSQASPLPGSSLGGLRTLSPAQSFEREFRERERRDLASIYALIRQQPRGRRLAKSRQQPDGVSRALSPSSIIGIPTDPVVGATYQINANVTGNTCSDPKQLRGALVVAVLPHTIVLSDETSPAGGWTTAEMAAFGQQFEDQAYPLAILNFGAPSDIDANGRVAIFFTPSVNAVPAAGRFAGRDLFPDECPASNGGEMFYVAVPDPISTDPFFSNKATMTRVTLSVLMHELQHLINAGRRFFVNGAPSPEEVWLNEGLSHIAEELLYYQVSGNATQTNIDLDKLRSSQAQLDAVNSHQVGNLGQLSEYMRSPETNSPFAMTDELETRGAIWELLRYSADRNVGADQSTWFALVNTTRSGQANFNAVFGDIITMTRDLAVAQFTDDAGLGVPANFTHPSWNYRSVLPALNINSNAFPLLTRPLLSTPVEITLNGGGAGYLRFRVAASVPATIAANSAGQAVPPAVEFVLVRTQ